MDVWEGGGGGMWMYLVLFAVDLVDRIAVFLVDQVSRRWFIFQWTDFLAQSLGSADMFSQLSLAPARYIHNVH